MIHKDNITKEFRFSMLVMHIEVYKCPKVTAIGEDAM